MVAPARNAIVAVSADAPPLTRKDAAFLSRTAAAVRGKLKNAAFDMMAAGRLLCAARRRIGRGRFVAWLRSEDGPGVKKDTAYRLMSVAEAFGSLTGDVLRNIPKGTLYVLAQPEVPQSLREYVVEQASDGKVISQTDALRLIEDHRKPVTATPRGYEVAPSPARPKVDPAAVHAADNWLALLVTLKSGGSLHITAVADDENGDKLVTVTMFDAAGKPRTVTRSTLEDAVVELGGLKRMKVCKTCMEPKRLDEFSRLKDTADGRNRACLQCERERVAEASRAKTFAIAKNQSAEPPS